MKKPQAPIGKPASLSAQEISSALWDNIFGSGADARRMRNFNQTVAAAEGGDRSADARIMRNPDGTPRSALPSFEPDVGGIGMMGKLKVSDDVAAQAGRGMKDLWKYLTKTDAPLYHETSAENAIDLIVGGGGRGLDHGTFVSPFREYALGQGRNKGAMMQIDGRTAHSTPSFRKPALRVVSEEAGQPVERVLGPGVGNSPIVSVDIPAGLKLSKVQRMQLARNVKAGKLIKEELPDGTIRYSKPRD